MVRGCFSSHSTKIYGDMYWAILQMNLLLITMRMRYRWTFQDSDPKHTAKETLVVGMTHLEGTKGQGSQEGPLESSHLSPAGDHFLHTGSILQLSLQRKASHSSLLHIMDFNV